MSLPKEPRQKMINMMYLVLTALLALNVSNEVLEAFKTVDKSITTSNKSLDTKNKVIYEAFKDELNDAQTKTKAAIWAPKADKVKQLSADLSSYIDNMKLQLKKESQLKIVDGKEDFREDDLDAATRLFAPDKDFDKGEGQKLYDALSGYKKNVLAVLNPDEFADNPKLQEELKLKIAEFEKTLPLDMTISEKANSEKIDNPAKKWTYSYFHMTPTIASLTILSKFQNDVKNSEAQMVDYIHSQIGKVKVVYDKFSAIAQSNRTYAMPGDEIEITAGVGAFSDAAKPKITIDGQNMPINDGKALFKTTAGGSGEHSVAVRIEYTKPDGTPDFKNEIVKYTVGTPSGASVFLEKMNVLYIGVDNPMTISAGSAGREKMQVNITNGAINSAGGDRYIAKPASQGTAKINVTVNGKTTPFEMRVKRLPNPTAMVGDKTGGPFSAASFKAQGGLFARLLDTDFEAPFQVLGYTVGGVVGGIYRSVPNDGARWSPAADALIKQATPGSQIFFDQIRVKGPDNIVRELPGIFFNLK
jgi:gliding motility-associated protein GldM